ncbi:DEAD/DEAH box helicase [Rummeliibacillus pycnus]|uniref:DEAD/DEAH box helicase n=1 Tax=Rummeliibacillus pycnus TaxID=101070 RepID=UPI003D2BF2E2
MHFKLNKTQPAQKLSSPSNLINYQLRDFLTGRLWLRDHSPFMEETINKHVQMGYIQTIPGVQTIASTNKLFSKINYICNRCQNQNPEFFATFNCANCEQICVYCRHCINMGRVSNCSDLMKWSGPKRKLNLPNHSKSNHSHIFHWEGTFTPQQKKASEELIDSVKKNRYHLTHAVCGAGKTEILFPAIAECLKRNKRVCVATPRTDVVLELAPRIQKVFPNTFVQALYGGAIVENRFSPLIVATTHQLYRFIEAFDIVIVDEADAFPYTFDKTLQQAVNKAKKPDAPIFYVTATPSEDLIEKVKKLKGGYSFIPRRYHGHPLPIPRYDTLFNYQKQMAKGKIPKKLQDWTNLRLANNQPFLIFFPTIELMEKAVPLFQKYDPQIEAVHAEDPDRKEKVLALREKKVPGLLTTTILERGITIPMVQVAVVGAESGIFTSSALIQVGGRVGRSADCPTGDLVFYHHGITLEMDEARKEIIKLNKMEVLT